MVKDQGKTMTDFNTGLANISSSLGELDNMTNTVNRNPNAVGSFGENTLNWIGNNINDIFKASTDDRLDRSGIQAYTGKLAAQLRSAVETGVMTKDDVERYMKIMGNEDDSPQEFIKKNNELKNTLIKDMSNRAKAYGKKLMYNTETGEFKAVPLGGM